MSYDYLEFKKAYRFGDAISVEVGYQLQSPIWEHLGQIKYVERHYDQQEVLFKRNPFSRLQEVRLNRCVRRYSGETGKHSVAQDEAIEHANRILCEFPSSNSA